MSDDRLSPSLRPCKCLLGQMTHMRCGQRGGSDSEVEVAMAESEADQQYHDNLWTVLIMTVCAHRRHQRDPH